MHLKFCLLDADYVTERKATVRLVGVDEHGNSVMALDDSFEPYFYVLPKRIARSASHNIAAAKKSAAGSHDIIEKLKKSKMVTRVEETTRTIAGEEREALKVFVSLPQDAYKVREAIKHNPAVEDTFEYSVNFYKRYMMDKGFYPLDWLVVDGEDVSETNSSPAGSLSYKKIVSALKIKKVEGKDAPKLKVLAFDTEVVDKTLIMISLASENFHRVLTYKKSKNSEVCKDEKEMLERFVQIINEQDPDLIVTFNGDQFDFEIIRERADALKVPLKLNRDGTVLRGVRRGQVTAAKLQGRIHIDLFPFVDTVLAPQLQFEAITLADVSQELIGETKLEMSFEELVGAWKNGKIDRLAEYCLKDSVLTFKLAHLLIPQILELSRVSGQLPFDISRMAYGTLVESFFLRKGAEHNTIAPNSPHWAEVEKRRRMRPYQGGYVKEPKIGLHDDIAVFDFRSLYPSIIVTYNLSPETFGCGHKDDKARKVPGVKHYFCSKVKGFIPTHLKSIIEQRLAIKNEMSKHAKGSPQYKQLDEEQKAIKILANATYGYMAYAGSRWYSREAAESAAAYGRYHVQKIIAEAEKEGFDVLYADTDSVFVKLKTKDKTENKMMKQNRGQRQNEGIDETEKTLGKKSKDIESAAEKFHSKINKALPGILELELQGIYKRGLFVPQKLGTYTAKKRYALIDGKGEVTVRGFEAVRRDWCDLSKQLQHEVLRLVLKGKEKEAVAKVRDVVKRVKERRVTIDEISIRTMLGKELDEYKATGPHIAVAKKLKEEGHDMPMGTVISYVITKSSGAKESISSRAKPSDKVGVKDYDVDYYLENQILAVALRVLQVLGYTAEEFG